MLTKYFGSIKIRCKFKLRTKYDGGATQNGN